MVSATQTSFHLHSYAAFPIQTQPVLSSIFDLTKAPPQTCLSLTHYLPLPTSPLNTPPYFNPSPPSLLLARQTIKSPSNPILPRWTCDLIGIPILKSRKSRSRLLPCLLAISFDQVRAPFLHQYCWLKRKTIHGIFALTIEPLTPSRCVTAFLFQQLMSCLMNSEGIDGFPSSILCKDTIKYWWTKQILARPHLERTLVIMNSVWCPLGYAMPHPPFKLQLINCFNHIYENISLSSSMTFWYIVGVFLIIFFIWKLLLRFSWQVSSLSSFPSVHSPNKSLNT